MSHRFYYVTDDAAVVKALKQHFDCRRAVHDAGVAFANRFGGGALFGNIHLELVGVAFDKEHPPKPADPDLWTKPNKHGMRQPKRGTELRKEWDAAWPKLLVNEAGAAWHKLIGYSWGFESGIGYAVKGAKAYFTTAPKPLTSKKLVEIKASDYIKAVEPKEKK